jgi:hypothetical protein
MCNLSCHLKTPQVRKKLMPPYRIPWMTQTSDVGPVETKKRLVDVRHMNAILIVPGIVYNLSTKLQKGVLHDHLGQNQEINLIKFITRVRYATQRGPYLTIHGAYTQYTTLNPTKYIQG